MIFPKLNYETVAQVNDKVRLDASYSYASELEISSVEIKPSSSEDFVSVFDEDDNEKWYLDYEYETSSMETITVRVTAGGTTKEKSYSINILSVEEDALLSVDADLYPYEPSILKYLPVGKASFIYAHRSAQEKILFYLDEQRIYKKDYERYTKFDLSNITDPEFKYQFKLWSVFETLMIIMESSQMRNEDLFEEKKMDYQQQRDMHRNRASLRLDQDDDGELDDVPYNIRTTFMVRR